MVSKCANPTCKARFKRLHEGRLFHFEVVGSGGNGSGHPSRLMESRKGSTRVEHFWLCPACSVKMTLTYDRLEGISLVPIVFATARIAAAS